MFGLLWMLAKRTNPNLANRPDPFAPLPVQMAQMLQLKRLQQQQPQSEQQMQPAVQQEQQSPYDTQVRALRELTQSMATAVLYGNPLLPPPAVFRFLLGRNRGYQGQPLGYQQQQQQQQPPEFQPMAGSVARLLRLFR